MVSITCSQIISCLWLTWLNALSFPTVTQLFMELSGRQVTFENTVDFVTFAYTLGHLLAWNLWIEYPRMPSLQLKISRSPLDTFGRHFWLAGASPLTYSLYTYMNWYLWEENIGTDPLWILKPIEIACFDMSIYVNLPSVCVVGTHASLTTELRSSRQVDLSFQLHQVSVAKVCWAGRSGPPTQAWNSDLSTK